MFFDSPPSEGAPKDGHLKSSADRTALSPVVPEIVIKASTSAYDSDNDDKLPAAPAKKTPEVNDEEGEDLDPDESPSPAAKPNYRKVYLTVESLRTSVIRQADTDNYAEIWIWGNATEKEKKGNSSAITDDKLTIAISKHPRVSIHL